MKLIILLICYLLADIDFTNYVVLHDHTYNEYEFVKNNVGIVKLEVHEPRNYYELNTDEDKINGYSKNTSFSFDDVYVEAHVSIQVQFVQCEAVITFDRNKNVNQFPKYNETNISNIKIGGKTGKKDGRVYYKFNEEDIESFGNSQLSNSLVVKIQTNDVAGCLDKVDYEVEVKLVRQVPVEGKENEFEYEDVFNITNNEDPLAELTMGSWTSEFGDESNAIDTWFLIPPRTFSGVVYYAVEKDCEENKNYRMKYTYGDVKPEDRPNAVDKGNTPLEVSDSGILFEDQDNNDLYDKGLVVYVRTQCQIRLAVLDVPAKGSIALVSLIFVLFLLF